eukprot:1235520-Pyramimonas_sp.AAC.1
MRAQPLGPSAELPMRPRNVCGVPAWVQWCHASAATGALAGALYEARKCVRGVPTWVRWCHAIATTGALGG